MSENNLKIQDLFAGENEYNIEVELPFSKKIIKMREMVTADQKSFLKQTVNLGDQEFIQRKIGVLFNDLLEKVCLDLDLQKMTLQDKLYLLLFIRTRLKNEKTQLEVTCDECNKPIRFTYDLTRFNNKIKELANKIKIPKTVKIHGTEMIINSIVLREEIQSDELLSNNEWVKKEEIGISELSNMLRVSSAIKTITTPQGSIDMTEYHMKERYEALMRMPATMMADVVQEISDMVKEMFDMMSDKFEVPCLADGCNGKKEVNVQIGDDGFFIKQSSESDQPKTLKLN